MKKIIIGGIILALFFLLFSNLCLASSENTVEKTKASSTLVEIKENSAKTIEDYKVQYGNETYGTVAYILNMVRIYSIPFCFVGIVISAIYRYVIGIRKLDVQDTGFGLMIGIFSVLVICQVLPLIFAIVVKGWRG